jgi:hypothetical protein
MCPKKPKNGFFFNLLDLLWVIQKFLMAWMLEESDSNEGSNGKWVCVCERETERQREKEREKGCARRGWGGERGEEKYRTLCVTGTGHQQLLNATPT